MCSRALTCARTHAGTHTDTDTDTDTDTHTCTHACTHAQLRTNAQTPTDKRTCEEVEAVGHVTFKAGVGVAVSLPLSLRVRVVGLLAAGDVPSLPRHPLRRVPLLLPDLLFLLLRMRSKTQRKSGTRRRLASSDN